MENLDQENEQIKPAEALTGSEAETPKTKELNPRIIFGFLVVLTVVGLVFSVSHWFNALKLPFAQTTDLKELLNLNTGLSVKNSEAQNLLDMQNKDTDLDGLSDYEEFYLYKTSPYLPDTDSDGYSDFEEVKNNQDPNCPSGQDCGNSFSPSTTSADVLSNLPTNLSADQLRAMLVQGGMTAEQANAIDDATLQQLYQETLNDGTAEFGNTGNANSTGLSVLQQNQGLDTLTADQLRTLLLEQGLPEQDVDNLSDSDLQLIWQEILKLESESNNAN